MRAINFALAVGTLIIVGALIVLGIHAFYPPPASPSFRLAGVAPGTPPTPAQQRQFATALDAYNARIRVYNRNVFFIANVVGVLVFVAAFLAAIYLRLSGKGILVGGMLAGFWGMLYGYGSGWGSVDDKLKFAIGLLLAVVVLGGSLWLIQRQSRLVNTA